MPVGKGYLEDEARRLAGGGGIRWREREVLGDGYGLSRLQVVSS